MTAHGMETLDVLAFGIAILVAGRMIGGALCVAHERAERWWARRRTVDAMAREMRLERKPFETNEELYERMRLREAVERYEGEMGEGSGS
jgi:hypothetical protein